MSAIHATIDTVDLASGGADLPVSFLPMLSRLADARIDPRVSALVDREPLRSAVDEPRWDLDLAEVLTDTTDNVWGAGHTGPTGPTMTGCRTHRDPSVDSPDERGPVG